ncbi:MAG TPA: S-methyl-5-thioribose-1-phosphate isomerase [Candidatus Limnocylindrales bacterium]|nr:S-methyl-5-thioribose-1-phosphate isomerase [Candidatus Limnocylindrales bacterium]
MSDTVQPPDPNRRRFFRQLAGEVVTSVGSALGAAQTLQAISAEAARDLLAPDAPAGTRAAAGVPVGKSRITTAVMSDVDGSTGGWRSPFRWDGDVCRIVDQRRLPGALVDLELRSAGDTVTAINDGALVGAPVQAQVAAVTLALVAATSTGSRGFARRATIRGAGNALRTTRPGSAAVTVAVERMLALLEQLGVTMDGERVAGELRAEAERIIAEAVDDHGALVGHLLTVLPGEADEPLHVLAAGSTGAMAGGQFGTALSAIQTLHHAGRPVHALVTEGRPGLEGSRIAAWELRQAGVPHALVTDAAAPGCIAAGEVRVVLVGADRIAANGDVITTAGAYPLALACAATDIPFIVCAATPALDPDVAEGAAADLEEGRPGSVLRIGDLRIAPEGTQIRNPLQDLVPSDLVTAIVTETGVLRAPYGPAIEAAAASGAARRATSAGFAALEARRAAEVAGAGEPGVAPVDVAALRNAPRAGEH